MNKDLLEVLEARAARRDSRRGFIKAAGTAAVGVTALAACSDNEDDFNPPVPPPPVVIAPPPPPPPPPPPAAITDADILNFALNLEYLEAEFYSFAVFGTGLSADLKTGTGTAGTTTAGQAVPFQDAVVRQYAREIAQDEIAHVRFLRSALGSAAVASPNIDVGVAATGAFSRLAQAAGLVPPGGVFNPYANDESFLLGAFIFEDVGVTAYQGAAPLLTNKGTLTSAAGILAAEAYHASLVRTLLYRRGIGTNDVRFRTGSISDLRDGLDSNGDQDQGVVGTAAASNIVPTDANGLTFARPASKVLNILYATRSQATAGGFFPTGVNGVIRQSTDPTF